MHWLSTPTALVAAHLVANVVWIGSLLATALLAGRGRFSADPAEVGSLARRVYVSLAVPAFLGSFATGVARIALEPRVYAHMPWMHAKLTLAFAVIVLHHIIGGRARRVANGDAVAARGVAFLALATFACASGAVLLGVGKSLPQ